MRSATSLLAATGLRPVVAALCGCPPGLTFLPPAGKADFDMVVTQTGPVVHGTLSADINSPCEVSGWDLTFPQVRPAVATVDWFAPSRPVDDGLPVLTAIRPQDEDLGTAPESGFFGLWLFDVAASPPEGNPPCTVTCGGQRITDAYVVLAGVATDEEVANLGMTPDVAKETIIERTEQRDLEPRVTVGCTSLAI